MIVIVGESASGKTTLQNMFVRKHPMFKKVVTYTTRPMRDGEIDGVDYHFVSLATFHKLMGQDFFIEHAQYRDWFYGTAREDCYDGNVIAVLTPAGMRTLKRLVSNVTTIYLHVDRRSRMIKILNRGDNIDEAYRRNLSDAGQFDGIANEVDYVIDNPGYQMDEQDILKWFEAIVDREMKNDV